MAENSNLLAEQRRALILDEVRRRGGVRVNELTRRLNVSDMTVRRDLDALARQGMVEKVHGGAVPVLEASTHEPGFEAKTGWEPEAKEDIARTAAALVRPGSAVALSAGTTTHALARQLLRVQRLTVVTNSVRVADVFEDARRRDRDGATVVLTGGIRTPSDALVGPLAELALRELHVDMLFLGCHGIDPEAGLTTPNLAEATTNRAWVASAQEIVVLADSSKWGVVGLADIGPLSLASVVVTDSKIPRDALAALEDAVESVLVVDVP